MSDNACLITPIKVGHNRDADLATDGENNHPFEHNADSRNSFGGIIATISKSLHDHDIGVMRANGERAGEATAEVDQNNPDAGFHW